MSLLLLGIWVLGLSLVRWMDGWMNVVLCVHRFFNISTIYIERKIYTQETMQHACCCCIFSVFRKKNRNIPYIREYFEYFSSFCPMVSNLRALWSSFLIENPVKYRLKLYDLTIERNGFWTWLFFPKQTTTSLISTL